MQLQQSILAAGTAALLPTLASAWAAPEYDGFREVWSERFTGDAGDRLDTDRWNYVTIMDVNNELQDYTDEQRNVQISGGETLQIVPWLDSNGKWTSGRVETKRAFKADDGEVMAAEGHFRFGDNDPESKRGYWPAFWMIGEAVRHGTEWPECGEIDIFEKVNGDFEAHGTVHCDHEGGICNTPTGIGATVDLDDHSWHTWRVEFDRSPATWREETITWFKDGQQFHQVGGEQIGDEDVWATLAHEPFYFIVNLAIGGDWPGDPNDATLGGYGNMMEIAYVAVYKK